MTYKSKPGQLPGQYNIPSVKSVDIVILSMVGPAYINGKRGLSGGFVKLHPVNKQNAIDTTATFQEGMRKTLKFLTDMNKKVIFVVSTPRLDFLPQTCVGRPLHRTHLKSPCAMNRATFEQDNAAYRKIVFDTLSEFPRVIVFDSAAELCDEKFCWVIKNGKMLYRDDAHLSRQGSEYLAARLIKLLTIE